MARPWITISKLSDGVKIPSETKNSVYPMSSHSNISIFFNGNKEWHDPG
ncbi:hypothetical protein [Clostridium brassicae]|uniref:Uncharacterized protein n=1 Tax=Clostridium brassicae TaxID=2999072 RepID=A0ABT4DAG8_9CLOT|nr:hypothetical protein [Clostridium brassicae]MCY6958653.1 hypothetical protein [Clostridium brassicae]